MLHDLRKGLGCQGKEAGLVARIGFLAKRAGRALSTAVPLTTLFAVGTVVLTSPSCDETVPAGEVRSSWSDEFKERMAWADAFEAARCERQARCPDSPFHSVGVDSCTRQQLVNPVFRTLAGNPAYRFDRSKGQGCLAVMSGLACDSIPVGWGVPEACWSVFQGTLAPGKPCNDVLQDWWGQSVCKQGWCSGAEDQCPRSCVAPMLTGGACTHDKQCASGLCVQWRCVENQRVEIGEACGHSWHASLWPCPDGAQCTNLDPYVAAGTCVRRPGIGEKCNVGGYMCLHGAVCQPSGPSTWGAGVCRPVAAVGQGCKRWGYYDSDCEWGAVCLSQAVSTSVVEGVCAKLKDLGEGCSASEECRGWDTWCQPGELGAGVCALLPAEGDPCLDDKSAVSKYFVDGRCNAALRCNEILGRCELRWPTEMFTKHCGEGCSAGENCIWGKCTPAPGDGEFCFLPPPSALGLKLNPCAAGLRCNELGICRTVCH